MPFADVLLDRRAGLIQGRAVGCPRFERLGIRAATGSAELACERCVDGASLQVARVRSDDPRPVVSARDPRVRRTDERSAFVGEGVVAPRSSPRPHLQGFHCLEDT